MTPGLATCRPARAEALRVVHVASRCAAEGTSGVDAVVYFLSRAQAALGHDVQVVSVDALTECAPDAMAPGGPSVGLVLERDRGVWQALRAGNLAALVRPRRTLVARVLAARPDVVHFHSVHLPEHVGLAAVLRQHGIPYCVTTHGGLSPHARRRGRVRKALFAWLCERHYLNHAAFVHALTADEAAAVRAYGLHTRIVTVANGFDPSALQPPRNPYVLGAFGARSVSGRLFLFVGRLDTTTKGLDLLVDALAAAAAPGARLAVAGPDWHGQQAALERRTAALGLSGRVRFVGPAVGQHKADLFGAADVFVHPSRSEGVSLSVLEGAARGTPCLLTDAADPLGAVSAGGGAVTVSPTVPALARGLETFARMDRAELTRMGARARAVVQTRFTWPGTAQVLVDAYAAVAVPGRPC